eukprot:5673335-Amphidinium_carterae.1
MMYTPTLRLFFLTGFLEMGQWSKVAVKSFRLLLEQASSDFSMMQPCPGGACAYPGGSLEFVEPVLHESAC